jgi:hypothetical protein
MTMAIRRRSRARIRRPSRPFLRRRRIRIHCMSMILACRRAVIQIRMCVDRNRCRRRPLEAPAHRHVVGQTESIKISKQRMFAIIIYLHPHKNVFWGSNIRNIFYWVCKNKKFPNPLSQPPMPIVLSTSHPTFSVSQSPRPHVMPMLRASQPPPVSPSRGIIGAPFTSHYHDALALASASALAAASTQSVSDSSLNTAANDAHSSHSQRGVSNAKVPVASAMRPTNQQLLLQRAQQRSAAAAAAAAQAEPSPLSISEQLQLQQLGTGHYGTNHSEYCL